MSILWTFQVPDTGFWVRVHKLILRFDDLAHPYAELFAVALSLGAILFAYRQFRDSRKLIRDAQRTAKQVEAMIGKTETIANEVKDLVIGAQDIIGKTETIANAMSTRFVGMFPLNLKTVVELIAPASESVDIMVDIVAYGHYSTPQHFDRYEDVLRKLALNKAVTLRMLVYGDELTQTTRDDQLGGVGKFGELTEGPTFKHYFGEVHRGQHPPTNYEEFVKIIGKREQDCHNSIKARGADIRTSNDPFRFFLWLVDGVEAAFSFQTYGEHFDEICFRTRDGNLISTFTRLFSEEWQKRGPGSIAC